MCSMSRNVSKQTVLLDGSNIGLPKWHVCASVLILSEGMNDISSVKVHLKTCSGNVNIGSYSKTCLKRLLKNKTKNCF